MSRKKSTAAAAPSAEPAAPVPAPLSAPPPVGRFELVETNRIVLSRTNPRKYFDPARMAELEASVREHGIIVPLIARYMESPVNGRDLELVAGERRLTAAGNVGREVVPVVIQELTDEQAFDVQLLENGQRTDIHPLEEADAFRHKRDHFHRSIEEIAQQTGKTPLYVTTRLKLTELCDAARKAFLEGKVASAAIALLIARIPDEKLQRDALKSITEYGGEGMSYRQARDHVQREYMLELGRAPFSIARADLVPEAGACTTCQKRTGNQRELFEDVESKDICTDPTCYRDKVDAEWKARVAAAKNQGIEVVSATDAKKLFYSAHSDDPSGGEWVGLDRTCYQDTANRARTYRQLLGGKKAKPDAIARNPHSAAIVEMVRSKTLKKRLKEAGHDFDAERRAAAASSKGVVAHDTAKWKEEEARLKRERAIEARVRELRGEALAKVIEATKPDKAFWRAAAELLGGIAVDLVGESAALVRRGVITESGTSATERQALTAYLDGLTEDQLRGCAVELLFEQSEGVAGGDELRGRIADDLGLDEKELKKRAVAELKEKEKAAAKEGKKSGKKKPAEQDDEE